MRSSAAPQFGFELEHLLHADEAHALVGELLDAAQQLDVAIGVAPAAAARARGPISPLRS